jgi:hypothetical protein
MQVYLVDFVANLDYVDGTFVHQLLSIEVLRRLAQVDALNLLPVDHCPEQANGHYCENKNQRCVGREPGDLAHHGMSHINNFNLVKRLNILLQRLFTGN